MSERKHRHHLIPKHMGGDDSEENLTPPISIELHAEFHRQLWEDLGHVEDYIAWKCLSGRMTTEEARLAAAKSGQDRSEKYKQSRKVLGEHLKTFVTSETRSKGGKKSASSLVKWQQANPEKFKTQCSENGKKTGKRQEIPHQYKGKTYMSKKELQKEHKIYNNLFYKLLKSGEIKRLDKMIEAY
jgi:hypothetical protein